MGLKGLRERLVNPERLTSDWYVTDESRESDWRVQESNGWAGKS